MSIGAVSSINQINYRINTTYNPLLEEGLPSIQTDSFLPIYQAQVRQEPFPLKREMSVVYPCLLIPLHTDKYNQAKIKGVFQSVIERYNVPLKNPPNYRAGTDAFGKYIRKLLFSEDFFEDSVDQGAQEALTENMKVVAQEEGFQLIFCKTPFPRDSFILAKDGKHFLCLSKKQDLINKAIDLTLSKTFVHREGARNHVRHLFFEGSLGAAKSWVDEAEKDYSAHFRIREPTLPFYLEGGNQYSLDNPKGQSKLLIGEENFWTAFNHLFLSDRFSNKCFLDLLNQKTEEIKSTLTQNKIQAILLEMHSVGRIGKGEGVISPENIKKIRNDPRSKSQPLERATNKGYYKPLSLRDEQVSDLKPKIIEYVFQKNITLLIISNFFGVERENIHIIPQSSYHIDLHMRPGPKGSFFVQSYAFCCDILETIYTLAVELELTQKDIRILRKYLKCMKILEADFGPLMEQISIAIRKAGFTTIPTPATFYSNAASHSVNFMNAITGCSEKTGGYYYIVLGAGLGDRLGKILMEVYAQFLNTYQSGIHVHYVGYNPQQPENFFSARVFSTRENNCGVHCMSLDYETVSNMDKSSSEIKS